MKRVCGGFLIKLYFFDSTISPLSFLKSLISFIVCSSHALYSYLYWMSKKIWQNYSSFSYTCRLISPRGYYNLMLYVPKNKESIKDSSVYSLYFYYCYIPSSSLAKKIIINSPMSI